MTEANSDRGSASEAEMRKAIIDYVHLAKDLAQEDERKHIRTHLLNKLGLFVTAIGALATAGALLIGAISIHYNSKAVEEAAKQAAEAASQTKQAALQTNLSRMSLEEVQRAFVNRLRIDTRISGDHISITPRWINNGSTGTRNGYDQTLCQVPDVFSPKDHSGIPFNLGPKQENEGADCNIKLWFADQRRKQSWQLVLLFRMRYDDIFKKHHIFSECGVVDIPPNAPTPFPIDAQVCGGELAKYTCIDDDCKGDASWPADVH